MISIRRMLLWLALALPGAMMVLGLSIEAGTPPKELLHPSGEMSVRLMILALLPGPLAEFFGSSQLLRRWLSIRRNLGVAAFAYALLHLVFYLIDARGLSRIIAELPQPAIWTGWLAFAALTVPASISFDRAVRQLGRRWRMLQRLAYPAFIISLLHWLLLDWAWLATVIHIAPLVIAWCLRFAAQHSYGVKRSTDH